MVLAQGGSIWPGTIESGEMAGQSRGIGPPVGLILQAISGPRTTRFAWSACRSSTPSGTIISAWLGKSSRQYVIIFFFFNLFYLFFLAPELKGRLTDFICLVFPCQHRL
ncbi:hypothetical protein BDV25DRAFT_15257 [Aspergillus avenaceus]|uniref:Uncharacterized protein n=1 Tax=Aspergillus avenaceus TaxID=36643 RepID=A0A5N6U5M3_ASPAV|nr:hypothetical protein BDV25DRAFT_15257 [Aspergillus avenaceus]